MSDAAAEFWRFSLTIYGKPGVPAACLVLQDEFGHDVNVMLYASWLGMSGRGRLTRDALDAADRGVTPWRHEVVEVFRTARRAIKAASLPGSDELYAKAKAVELDAERFLQSRLVALAPSNDELVSKEDRLAAALANLALYVGDAPADPIRAALKAMG